MCNLESVIYMWLVYELVLQYCVVPDVRWQYDTEKKERKTLTLRPPLRASCANQAAHRSAFGEGASPGSAQTMHVAEGPIALEVAKPEYNE